MDTVRGHAQKACLRVPPPFRGGTQTRRTCCPFEGGCFVVDSICFYGGRMNHLDRWSQITARANAREKRSRRGPTPEGAVLKSHLAYLPLCRLGRIKRHNTGAMQTDTGQVVRFGEPGTADLEIQLTGSPRSIWIELKAPDWKPPKRPQEGASRSSLERWRHHDAQERFLAYQRSRGNVAFFSRSLAETYSALSEAGFTVPNPSPEKKPCPLRS